MDERNEIDDLFRELSTGYSSKPPAGSWERIASSMDKKRRSPAFLWYWAASIAGLALMAGTVFFFDHDIDNSSIVSQKTHAEIEQHETSTDDIVVGESQKATEETDANIYPKDSGTIHKKLAEPQKTYYSEARHSDKLPTPKPLSDKQVEPLKPSEIIEEPSQIPSDLLTIAEAVSLSDTSKKSDELIIAMDPGAIPDDISFKIPESHYKKALWLTAVFGQSNSYHTAGSLRKAETTQVQTGKDEIIASPALRLELGFELSPAIALTTGLHRGSFGNISGMVFNESNIKYVNIDEFGASSSGYFNASEIYTLVDNSGIQNISQLSKFDKIKVEYEFIDIPLSVRVSMFSGRKAEISAVTGLNMLMVQENTVSMGKGDEWFEVGSVENVRERLYGANARLGFNYALLSDNSLQLTIQNGIRYYINSINTDQEFTYRPYSYEVMFGLRYRMNR